MRIRGRPSVINDVLCVPEIRAAGRQGGRFSACQTVTNGPERKDPPDSLKGGPALPGDHVVHNLRAGGEERARREQEKTVLFRRRRFRGAVWTRRELCLVENRSWLDCREAPRVRCEYGGNSAAGIQEMPRRQDCAPFNEPANDESVKGGQSMI